MPGVKGSGGFPPKRSDQRRNTTTPAMGEPQKVDGAVKVPVPRASSDWHPVAKRWYQSLAKSGQAQYYEPSDWATAYLVAESISRELSPQMVGGEMMTVPPKGASMAAWLKAMTTLMVTEGDRRRLALELQRPEADGEGKADVSELDELRHRRSG